MNKIKAVIVILIVSLSFTGCSFGDTNNVIFSVIRSGYSLWKERSKGNEDEEKIKQPNDYAMIVLKAIENKDVKSIRNIMCPYIRENDEKLDEKIKGMFEFIDGQIISYDGPRQNTWHVNKDTWEYIEKDTNSDIHDAKTNTGHEYYISVGVTEVDKNHEGYEGVVSIMVIDEGEYTKEGEYNNDAVYKLEYPEMYEDY